MKAKHLMIYLSVWAAYFSLLLLTSCKTKYVSVPEYHTQYVVRTDTLTQKDSVYEKEIIRIWQKGDTIYRDREVEKASRQEINKSKTDTFIKRDSVYLPKPVERELTKAEQRYITIGKYAAGAIICLVFIITGLAVWLWHRKKGQKK